MRISFVILAMLLFADFAWSADESPVEMSRMVERLSNGRFEAVLLLIEAGD